MEQWGRLRRAVAAAGLVIVLAAACGAASPQGLEARADARKPQKPARQAKGVGLEGPDHWGTGKPRLAAVPFETRGLSAREAAKAGQAVVDLLLSQVRTEDYELYDRERIARLIEENDVDRADLL